MKKGITYGLALTAICVTASAATSVIDFNLIGHGEVAGSQYTAATGITISASDDNNPNTVLPVIGFDTELTGSTSDSDLQRVGINPDGWSGGNLAPTFNAGTALIVQENNDVDGNGVFTDPDDRGVGGIIRFDVASDVNYRFFEAILVDFEENGNPTLRFTDRVGNSVDFSPFFAGADDNFIFFTGLVDPFSLVGTEGDASATLDFASELASVEFIFDDASGAIGAVLFSDDSIARIPEPSTSLLSLFGLSTLLFRRRRS